MRAGVSKPRMRHLGKALAVALLGAAACSSQLAGEPPRRARPRATRPVVMGEIEPARRDYLVPASDVTFSRTSPYRVGVPAAVEELTVTGCRRPRWTIEGPAATPREARGAAITVTFSQPGEYRITARCGDRVVEKVMTLCDFRARIEPAVAYFGESIDFSRVTIDYDGTLSDASWVAHDDVSIGDGVLDATAGCPGTEHYVHELGHVWEYQHGQNQLARGTVDQLMNLTMDVYDYGGAAGVRRAVELGRPLETFNLEQQAEIFAHDYYFKSLGTTDDRYAQDLAALTAPALAARPTIAAGVL